MRTKKKSVATARKEAWRYQNPLIQLCPSKIISWLLSIKDLNKVVFKIKN